MLHRLSAARNCFGTLQLRQLARQPCTDVPHFLLEVRCCSPQMFAGHILEVALEDSMDPPREVGVKMPRTNLLSVLEVQTMAKRDDAASTCV